MASSLDWIVLIGILGSLASVVGLVYAFAVARQGQRQKLLAYEVTHPLPLASVLPDRVEHRLSILYEREGSEPVNVRGAFVRFVQLGNLGREAVRRSDIASSDPLRLEIEGSAVLDVAAAGTSREVIDFRLGAVEQRDKRTSVPVSFDFLDYKDSAIVRILTDSAQAGVALHGTIIGMPQGIVHLPDLRKRPILNPIGCVVAILLQLTAIVAALVIFRSATGSWSLLWVLLLPIAAVAVPALIVALVVNYLWPKGPQWAKTPSLPKWFISRYMLSRDLLFDEPFGALVPADVEIERPVAEARRESKARGTAEQADAADEAGPSSHSATEPRS